MSDEKKPRREAVYDEQVSPLMEKVLAICKEHDVPMVASFQISDPDPKGEGDGEIHYCTSALLTAGDAAERLKRALDIILAKDRRSLLVTTRDVEGRVVSQAAVLG